MKKTKIGVVFGVALAATIILTCPAAAKNLGVPDFDPSNFDNPADNLFRPRAIGYTYLYAAEEEDGLVLDYISFTGASKTITIDGEEVECTVVYDVGHICPDLEYPPEPLEPLPDGCYITEVTWDWYAWDNDGNVWYFGEDTTA